MLREEELRKYSAELLGTFALVFIGCGSAVIAGRYIGNTGVSFAFGLTLLAMVYAIGNVSGCHINPAVTVGMLAAGRTTKRDALFYIIAQCVGGILAALVLWGIASGLNGYSLASDGLAQNGYGDHSPAGYSLAACFFAEVVLTAIFLFVILGATSKRAPAGSAGPGQADPPRQWPLNRPRRAGLAVDRLAKHRADSGHLLAGAAGGDRRGGRDATHGG